MTCVILSDGIDLSVGSTFALSAIICAELIIHSVPAPLAILIALVAGTLLGMVSGFLVTKGRLQPFIATLITMTAYRGFALILTNGKPVSRLAANDEMALGAVEAISGAGKNIMVVGFDATDDAIAAIKAGRIAATVAQQPELIGQTAVENAIKLINGETIPESIPVEVTLITKDNAS